MEFGAANRLKSASDWRSHIEWWCNLTDLMYVLALPVQSQIKFVYYLEECSRRWYFFVRIFVQFAHIDAQQTGGNGDKGAWEAHLNEIKHYIGSHNLWACRRRISSAARKHFIRTHVTDR